MQTAALDQKSVAGLVFMNVPGNFADALSVSKEDHARERRRVSAARPFRRLSVHSSITLRRLRDISRVHDGGRSHLSSFAGGMHAGHDTATTFMTAEGKIGTALMNTPTRREQMAARVGVERRLKV